MAAPREKGTPMKRELMTAVASVALCCALGGCAATSGGAGAFPTQDTTGEVRTPYDLQAVDAATRETGQGFIDSLDAFSAKLTEYKDADVEGRKAMQDELVSLYDKLNESFSTVNELSSEAYDSDMGLDTRMYVIDLMSYAYQRRAGYEETYRQIQAAESDAMGSADASTDAGADASADAGTDATASGALYDIDKVDPTVRAFCEEYEAFVDRYVEFMSRYSSADSTAQASMISDYSTLMQQEVEMADKAEKLDEQDATFDKDTYQYWIDVYARCSQKMVEATQ